MPYPLGIFYADLSPIDPVATPLGNRTVGGTKAIRLRWALRAASGWMRMVVRVLPADVGSAWLCETVH